ncbi:hypothetical protein WJX77_002354 [Trebouxia sp. C0004]
MSTTPPAHEKEHLRLLQLQLLQQHLQAHAHDPDTIALLEDLLPLDLSIQLTTKIHLALKRQVVLSYLQVSPPDLESSQAALEAYFTEALQAHTPQLHNAVSFVSFQEEATQLKDTISRAQAATRLGNVAAVQLGLESYPVSLADKALQDAISIITGRADCSAVQASQATLKEGGPGVSLPSSPAGSSAAEALHPSSQALLEQVQDPAGLSTQPKPGATACAVMVELSAGHDRIHVTLTPVNAQPPTGDSVFLIGQSAAATICGINSNAQSHAPSLALHGAARTDLPCPVSSPESDQAAVAMDGRACDAWQSGGGADVAAGVQTVKAQDVAAGNVGAVSQGPPLLDTQGLDLTLQDDSNAAGPMLVGQSPAASFSIDEMDNIHSSDQMRPRDSIPPTGNSSEHPEIETFDDQQHAAATISHAAPASEADERSQADLSSGPSSHLDMPAEMSSSAEAAGSDRLQCEEIKLDYPSKIIINAAAAVAATMSQLPDDQRQLPGDQPQLPGDQPVVTQSLPICSVELAPAPAITAEPDHPDNQLTDNGQNQSQPSQAGSAELAEQEAHLPVVLDQSQLQEVPKPCEDAPALPPIVAPLDDAPSRPITPLDAISRWEAASGCLIVPDSEEPDSFDQHSHIDMGYTVSVQSTEKVTPTQPPTEAQPSAVNGIQAQATDTAPASAVAKGSQDPVGLQCLRQQTIVRAGGSLAVDSSPVQAAGEASYPTNWAQPEEQLAAEHCADGVVAATLLMLLHAKGSQHTDRAHSDREAVPEHAAPPSALDLPAVDPAEEAQQQHAALSGQALEHLPAPLKTQSQLASQADAVSEGSDRQQQQQQLVDAAEAAQHTTAPQSMPSLWLHHQDVESQSDPMQQLPPAKVTEHDAPPRNGLVHQQEAECEGSGQQQQEQQEVVKSADAAEHVNAPQQAHVALTSQQLEPTAQGPVRHHQLPRQRPARDVYAQQGPSTRVQSAAEHDNLAEPEISAEREILAEPEILAEHDIVAEHESVPEGQALQVTRIVKPARISAVSVRGAKDDGAYSDARAVQVSCRIPCQPHLAATTDAQQEVFDTEHSVKAHKAGSSQQQPQQRTLCSDQDAPDCNAANDSSTAVTPQPDTLVMQQTSQPAAAAAATAQTTQQASPSSLQASQPDAKLTSNIAHATVRQKAGLPPSQGVGSPPHGQEALSPRAAVRDLIHMPAKQSGSQSHLSGRVHGSATAASGPAADMTDADLADKENNGCSLSGTGSDTQSKSQGLEEQQQGTAAAAAAAQVVAEAFTKQAPVARPRPVRRRPTLDRSPAKSPAALPVVISTSQHAKHTQADAVAVWKTSGRKRMRSEGTDAPVVLTDTTENTYPVAHPVPARKALPDQPVERPVQKHQQQRSDASRTVQPDQLQQRQQAQRGHEDAQAQHAKQDGTASGPQNSEQARQKSCELPSEGRRNAADRAQQAEHAQQAPLILNSKATGHALQAEHAQQEQHGKVTAHRQQTQRAQQPQHAVFDKPGKGAGQAQHAQQPQHGGFDKPGEEAGQAQHAQPAQRAQQPRAVSPLQADQQPTTSESGIDQSRSPAASPQTRAAGAHEGQTAVQSSGPELHVKRSHTAGDADERHKGALWSLAQSVMGGMAQRLQSQHSHTAAKPPLPGAAGHPQASIRASAPNQPPSGLTASHGAQQGRTCAETKPHRLAKRSSLPLSRSLPPQNTAQPHAPAAAAGTAPPAVHTRHHPSRPATPAQRPSHDCCETLHTAAKQTAHQMHNHGAVTQMRHQHVADSQPQHVWRAGEAQHAQRATHPMAPYHLQQAQQAQHAKPASHQQTRHRLHMGSAPAPMQGHTGSPMASGQALSREPGCMQGSSAGRESAAGGCKTAVMRDAVSAAVNAKSMASVPMIVPRSFRQHNARASLAVRAAIRAASPTLASEPSSRPAADRHHTSSSTGSMSQMLPGVQAVTTGSKPATAASEPGQMMTSNGSFHELLHGDPWTQEGGVVAYPQGCRQQAGQHPSTREEALQQPAHQQQQRLEGRAVQSQDSFLACSNRSTTPQTVPMDVSPHSTPSDQLGWLTQEQELPSLQQAKPNYAWEQHSNSRHLPPVPESDRGNSPAWLQEQLQGQFHAPSPASSLGQVLPCNSSGPQQGPHGVESSAPWLHNPAWVRWQDSDSLLSANVGLAGPTRWPMHPSHQRPPSRQTPSPAFATGHGSHPLYPHLDLSRPLCLQQPSAFAQSAVSGSGLMLCSGSSSLAGLSAGQNQQGCAASSSPAGPLDGPYLPHPGSARASGALQLQEAALPVEQASHQPYQNANLAQQGAHHMQEAPFAPKQASYQPYQVAHQVQRASRQPTEVPFWPNELAHQVQEASYQPHQVMQQQQHVPSWSDQPAYQQQVFSNLQRQQQHQQGQAFAEQGFAGGTHAGAASSGPWTLVGPTSECLLHPSRTATPLGGSQQLQGQLVQPESSLQQPQGHFQQLQRHLQQPSGHLHQALPASPPHRWLRAELDAAARLSHQAEQAMHEKGAQPTTETWLPPGRFPPQSVPQECVPVQQQGRGQQGVGQQGVLQHQEGVTQQQQHISYPKQQALLTGAATSSLSAKPSLACRAPGYPPCTTAVATAADKHQPQHDVCPQPKSNVMQFPAAWAQTSGHDFQLQPHQQQQQNGSFHIHQQLHRQLQQQRVCDSDRQFPKQLPQQQQQHTPAATRLHQQVYAGSQQHPHHSSELETCQFAPGLSVGKSIAHPYVGSASEHAMPHYRATGDETSAAAGLSFGNSITFQHVGGASPSPPHAMANSLPDQDSGPSVGPSMSLGNWLPQPDSSMAELPQTESFTAELHDPISIPQDMQRRQSSGGQLVKGGSHGQQQGSVQVSQAPDRHIDFHGERVLSGPARAPARSKADKRRRRCLLEIERELMRHSTSDEEECGGDNMQLPNPSAGKRQKTACTAERVVDLFAGI